MGVHDKTELIYEGTVNVRPILDGTLVLLHAPTKMQIMKQQLQKLLDLKISCSGIIKLTDSWSWCLWSLIAISCHFLLWNCHILLAILIIIVSKSNIVTLCCRWKLLI